MLDGRFYRRWMQGAFVRDWNAAAAWVQRERFSLNETTKAWDYSDKRLENYQVGACRWSKEAKNISRTCGHPPNELFD